MMILIKNLIRFLPIYAVVSWKYRAIKQDVFNMQDNFTINNVSRKYRDIKHVVLIMLMIVYKRKVCMLERKQKRLLIYYCVYSTSPYRYLYRK